MEESSEKVIENKKKPSRREYIIAAGIIFLCIITGLIYRAMTWEPKPDPESEKIIRELASREVYKKDPNELTDEDFAKITKFLLKEKELSDIKLLDKFTNVQKLYLINIKYPVNKIPKWMKFLAKYGIYDLQNRSTIGLTPLKKLSNLEILWINDAQVSNCEPLKGLTKLQYLHLEGTQVSRLEPLKDLKNLQTLHLRSTQVSNLEPIKDLKSLQMLDLRSTKVSNLEPIKDLKSLQYLYLMDIQVSSIEPIKDLESLQYLYLMNTQVSNLEPIKKLKNLKYFYFWNCPNITDEQIKDLQKALPELKISQEER